MDILGLFCHVLKNVKIICMPFLGEITNQSVWHYSSNSPPTRLRPEPRDEFRQPSASHAPATSGSSAFTSASQPSVTVTGMRAACSTCGAEREQAWWQRRVHTVHRCRVLVSAAVRRLLEALPSNSTGKGERGSGGAGSGHGSGGKLIVEPCRPCV